MACGVPSAEIFDAVAAEVGPLVRAESVGVHRYDPDGYATLVGNWGKLRDVFKVGGRWKLQGDDLITTVYRTEQPVRFDDYELATGLVAAEVLEAGVRSVVGSPIVVDGRLWGGIAVATFRAEALPADTESRISQFSELVATAISSVQARAEVERLVEEQAALRRVATMVARESSPEEVFAQVAHEVSVLHGLEVAGIFRYEPDGDITVAGNWGEVGDACRVGARHSLDGPSLVASVYETGRPSRRDGCMHGTGSISAEARKAGLRSAVASPIIVNGRLWGALAGGTSRPEALPRDAEARIAQFTELAATAIANVEARSDLAASRSRIAAAADEERRRVVRDLHDGAQQRLVQTIATLKLARRAIEQERPDVGGLVGEALQQAESANVELRELVHGILPSVLTTGGLAAGVSALASRMSIPVELDVAVVRLPPAVEATAYFIMAEALTNVAKHAHAHHASVSAHLQDHTLQMEVRDDGVGGARADGSGLVGLGDRVAALDGTLRIESPPDGGTVVAALLPLDGRRRR